MRKINLDQGQLENLSRLVDRIERANESPLPIALSAVPHLRELLRFAQMEENQ